MNRAENNLFVGKETYPMCLVENTSEQLNQTDLALLKLKKEAENEPSLKFVNELKAENLDGIYIYLVGGAVRDEILGLESNDYDLLVEGLSQNKLSDFLEKHGKIISDSDVSTGIYKFIPKGSNEVIDVALPRVEEYDFQSRKPSEVDVSNISVEEDLSRRDLTINSLALEIFSGDKLNLVDPYGAMTDIENKVIRSVGDPFDRFNEDPLRILRAAKFACKLNFSIAEETLDAMKSSSGLINQSYTDQVNNLKRRVSVERIQKEISNGLECDANKFIKILNATDLLSEVFPDIEKLKGVEQSLEHHSEGDVFIHTMRVLENIPNEAPLCVKLAGLFHDIGKFSTTKKDENGKISAHDHEKASAADTELALRQLKFPNEIIDKVVWLVENHMRINYVLQMSPGKRVKLMSNPLFKDLITLGRADDEARIRSNGTNESEFYDEICRVMDKIDDKKEITNKNAINGNDIMSVMKELGIPNSEKSKIINPLKEHINGLFVEGVISTKDQAMEIILDYLKNYKI